MVFDALNHLIAELFTQPSRVELIMCHFPLAEYPCNEHSHENLLQFDLFVDLCGSATVADREVKLAKVVTMLTYPGEKHGYTLSSDNKSACVYSMKLKVESDWPLVKERVFPSFTENVTGSDVLINLFQQLLRLSLNGQKSSTLLLVKLAKLLTLWPGGIIGDVDIELNEKGMDAVNVKIQQNLDKPPSIDELADFLNLSKRQFIRRFEVAFGMSAYKYITMLRLRRAKEHLSHGHMNLTQISKSLGFQNMSAFSRWFSRETGVRPSLFNEPPLVF